jgi:conjugal transfer pilus assembly protein TraV
MKTLRNIVCVITAAASLGGCVFGRAKYDCPAPNGVACMSARQIYAATETTDHVEKKTDAKPMTPASEAMPTNHATAGLVFDGAEMTLASTPTPPRTVDVIPENLPVRLPARILRVWVAGWEDDQGALHTPSVLYTEIAPRRWALGEPAPELSSTLQLVQPLQPAVPENASSTPRTERDGNSNQDGKLVHSNEGYPHEKQD